MGGNSIPAAIDSQRVSAAGDRVRTSCKGGTTRLLPRPKGWGFCRAIIYDAVITLCETGGQTSLDAALQLLAPFDEPPAGCTCLQTVTGDALHNAALEPPPFGPGFAAADLNGVDALEIWGSRFSTTAEDFVEYRLLRAGLCVKFRRFAGY